jgi:hypothetical protein
MANAQPTRTKKSTAAIINPDNVANFTLTSHKTAASAARAAKSQAESAVPVTGSGDNGDDDSDSQALDRGTQVVPPPTTTASLESEDGIGPGLESSDEDKEVHSKKLNTQLKGMYQFINFLNYCD